MRGAAPVPHRNSHLSLLEPGPEGRLPLGVDAVVVATSRPAEFLSTAISLTGALNCPILVLCSHRSKATEVFGLLGGLPGAVVTVSSTPQDLRLRMRTQVIDSALFRASGDIAPYLDAGNKRNVALLLGRLLGWRRVLFLDDDIGGLAPAEVGNAAAAIAPGGLRMAGWRYPEFPDNSVVCHALRSSGLPQEVFIGAGALLVDLRGRLPFFPPVYNEDWLFWYDDLATRKVGLAGEVTQREYDPFDVQRALREEFGDVLAEGLMDLVHAGRPVLAAAFADYWEPVLAGRFQLLDGIIRRLEHLAVHTRDARQHEKELLAVEASRAALEGIDARALADFVGAWRYDLYRWNALLRQLPRLSRVRDALGWLGITDVHVAGAW